MAYIGSTPESQNFISGTDYFNGTGSQTAFTLTRTVNSVNDVEVVVNNVIQQPNSYTVSGTTLTLSAAPSSGTSNVYVRYLSTNQRSFTVGNNTIGYNQLTTEMQSKFAMKNRIINGAMVIDQRNAGASITPTQGQYSVDRWQCYLTQSGKYTIQQNAGAVTPPVGYTKYLGVTSTSAYTVLSTDNFLLTQKIEGYNIADLGWGTANAKTVTLSFQVYSSLTGSFGGALINSSQNRSYPFLYTVSVANTWTTISITISGDTTGTWATDNSTGIWLMFGLGVGSTNSATAGSWTGTSNIFSATGATSVVGTNGATFYITGVQLEVGTSATGFEYRQYQQELALCQRYYFKNSSITAATDAGLAVGMQTSNVNTAVLLQMPVSMRAKPTLAQSNTIVSDNATFDADVTSFSTSFGTETTIYVNAVHSSAGSAGKIVLYRTKNSGGIGYVSFSAEL